MSTKRQGPLRDLPPEAITVYWLGGFGQLNKYMVKMGIPAGEYRCPKCDGTGRGRLALTIELHGVHATSPFRGTCAHCLGSGFRFYWHELKTISVANIERAPKT